MVKNLSNPLNARKVAGLLAADGKTQNLDFDERKISVFFSDNRISNLEMGLKQLKDQEMIPQDFALTKETKDILLAENFIDEGYSGPDTSQREEIYFEEVFENYGSIEFTAQLDSLKGKLMKSWSGGIAIEAHSMDNYDRKFGRPMKYFEQEMMEKNIEVGELQAFAVVYATEQLSLGDNVKDEVYDLMFGRFDKIKNILREKYGFQYSWPSISGASFIEMGKRYSVSAELADLAKKFKSISGLDTYADEVLQVFFLELVGGTLTDELAKKKIFYRWVEEDTVIEDFHQYLLPPSDFSIQTNLKNFLLQAVITHTVLTKLESTPEDLEDILAETYEMDKNQRIIYLAKKLEASLTKKTVLLQFGTTLANFFENLKHNPSNSESFIEIAKRYYDKSGSLSAFIATFSHNIRTALKNSSGMIRQYLIDMSNEELDNLIARIVDESLIVANNTISGEIQFENDYNINYIAMDIKLRSIEDESLSRFFRSLVDSAFTKTDMAFRDKELQKDEPVSKEGGLSELFQDFQSTISYHGNKNPALKDHVEKMLEKGLEDQIAIAIAHISNYLTYQVSSKEGANGEKMLADLISYFQRKAINLGNIELMDGTKLGDMKEEFYQLMFADLQQAYVIASLASKTRVEVYNAWNVIDNNYSRNAKYLNEFLIPNVLYWQRIPKKLIQILTKQNLINKSSVKRLIADTERASLVEAYSLLLMGAKQEINSFSDASKELVKLFNVGEEDVKEKFRIIPATGEAEIAQEVIFLWNQINEA